MCVCVGVCGRVISNFFACLVSELFHSFLGCVCQACSIFGCSMMQKVGEHAIGARRVLFRHLSSSYVFSVNFKVAIHTLLPSVLLYGFLIKGGSCQDLQGPN